MFGCVNMDGLQSAPGFLGNPNFTLHVKFTYYTTYENLFCVFRLHTYFEYFEHFNFISQRYFIWAKSKNSKLALIIWKEFESGLSKIRKKAVHFKPLRV